MRTHYDILQIQQNASPEVIKGAYRYLARKWHPDNNPDNRERALGIARVIKQAYAVLSDPELRQQHDDWIAAQRAANETEAEPVVAPESLLPFEISQVEVVHAPAPADPPAAPAAAIRKPFLVRLYRGDVPLVVSYWIFGVLIGIFVFNVLIINPLEENYLALNARFGDYFHTAVYTLLLASTAFFYLAIWKSAGKYAGPRYFGHLARGTVVASTTVITLAMGGALTQILEQDFDPEAAALGRALPYMIDDDTRMDSTTVVGNDIHHHYTLVRIDSVKFDAKTFAAALQPHLAVHACKDPEARTVLDRGGAIAYNYSNNDGRLVSQIAIKTEHCR